MNMAVNIWMNIKKVQQENEDDLMVQMRSFSSVCPNGLHEFPIVNIVASQNGLIK